VNDSTHNSPSLGGWAVKECKKASHDAIIITAAAAAHTAACTEVQVSQKQQ
jgi:hypothetical protein